jgi:hypothetical protein
MAGALLVILFSWSASARVFDMKDLNFAPYVRGTFGPSEMGKEAYVHAGGTGTDTTGTVPYNYSGELGFVWRVTQSVNLRVGAEIMQSSPVTNATGSSGAGVTYYTVDSNIFVFNPNLAIEIVLKHWKEDRLFLDFGAGYATVSLKNSYTMTTAGTAALSSLTDFTENGTGTAIPVLMSVGYEYHFADRAMLFTELGYRYFKVTSLDHTGNEKTIAEPNGNNKGDPLLNSNGSHRAFDLSGFFAGLSFRFYL